MARRLMRRQKHALAGETGEGVQVVQVIDRGGVCRRGSAGHPLPSTAETRRADRERCEAAESRHRL